VYAHNDQSSLLRYHLTVTEQVTSSIDLSIREPFGIPFTLRIVHNDKEILCKSSRHDCFVEQVVFLPGDKTTPSTYSLQASLDPRFTQEWEERRRFKVVEEFRETTAAQVEAVKKKQQDLLTRLTAEQLPRPSSSSSHSPAAAPASAVPPGGSTPHCTNASPLPKDGPGSGLAIGFQLTLFNSSSKIELKEDNTINDQLNVIKASWNKMSDGGSAGAPPPKPAAKPAKAPVIEEPTRQIKALESRERFLSNRSGMFLPYVKDGKLFATFEDEPGVRWAPPYDDAEWTLTAGDDDVSTTPRGSPIPGTEPTVPGQPPTLPPSLAQILRQSIVALHEQVNGSTVEMRQQRKQMLAKVTEVTRRAAPRSDRPSTGDTSVDTKSPAKIPKKK